MELFGKFYKVPQSFKKFVKFLQSLSRFAPVTAAMVHRGLTEGHSMWSCSGSSMKFVKFLQSLGRDGT